MKKPRPSYGPFSGIQTPFALFDDNLSHEGDLWLEGLCAQATCCDPQRAMAFLETVHDWQRQGHWVALALTYEFGYALEPRFHRFIRRGAVLAKAFAFERGHWCPPSHTDARILELLMHDGMDPLLCDAGPWQGAMTWAQYAEKVASIHALIREGECYQINFTYPLTAPFKGDPLALYWRLRETQPVRFGAFLRQGTQAILSRSPELFVARQGETLTCRPMKGTCAANQPDEALCANEKNRAENLMIVDLIRNDLGRLVPPGGVKVPALFTVEPYPTLKQMTSTITAAPVTANLTQILQALFPCGSITGAPKHRAIAHIHRLESAPRGLYCGALGWLAPHGDFRFSVPIRTMEARLTPLPPEGGGRTKSPLPEGRLRLNVGSGITSDANANEEWEECRLKARFAQIPSELNLIETLRCELHPEDARGGRPRRFVYPFLEGHLERLARSAKALGFACPVLQIRKALQAEAEGLCKTSVPTVSVFRVRLVLERKGFFTLETAPLPLAMETPVRVGLSSVRLNPDFFWLYHKTTARSLYTTALQWAQAQGLFDLLFLNEEGWVCEGARSSVFIRTEENGPWLTPELSCGLLPGVFRAHLLSSGLAQTARFDLETLIHAKEIALGNALRGWMPACWQAGNGKEGLPY
jgi:para-aminobenzoate synthetase / 4-amino-4-deoxychorismate lyase